MKSQRDTSDYVLTKVIDHVPHYIFWKDRELVFRGCNKIFAQQFGYADASGIVGKTDYDFPWSEELREKYRLDDSMVIQTGIPKLNYEESQGQTDGSVSTVLVSKVPYYDDEGNIAGVLGIYTDITERKRMEEALVAAKENSDIASQAKSEFLANMSHDLRTPLAGIIAIAEVLRDRQRDEGDSQNAQMLVLAGQQLLQLLNEILEITQYDLGFVPTDDKVFSILDVIFQLRSLLSPAFENKQLELRVELDDALPKILEGNSLLLHRILLNLLSNALKFTKTGFVALRAHIVGTRDQKAWIEFEVEDTGMGISAEHQEKVFGQFKRLSPAYEGRHAGAGLGLYLVKTFVESLQGTIRLESELNRGSRFICLLPFNLGDEKQLSADAKAFFTTNSLMPASNQPLVDKRTKMVDAGGQNGLVRVLLVEDTVLAQKAAKIKLESLGCEVEVTSNGLDAIVAFSEADYDILFIDIGLPDIDGYQVTARIREIENAQNQGPVPIIAFTAHVDKQGEQQCYAAGMDFVLLKPMLGEYAQKILEHYVYLKRSSVTLKNTHLNGQTAAVIDWSSTESILGDRDAAEEIFSHFMKELPVFQSRIWEAFNENRRKELKFVVHQLNCSAIYAPAPALKQVITELSETLKQSPQADLSHQLTRLDEQIAALNNSTSHHLSRAGT